MEFHKANGMGDRLTMVEDIGPIICLLALKVLGPLDRLSLLTVDTLLVNSSVAPLGFPSPPSANRLQHSLQCALPIVSGGSGRVSTQIEKTSHDFRIQ